MVSVGNVVSIELSGAVRTVGGVHLPNGPRAPFILNGTVFDSISEGNALKLTEERGEREMDIVREYCRTSTGYV